MDRFIRDYLDVEGKEVLVIGSESPWIEILALRNGAKHVTTLEYQKITSEDSRISPILPEDLNKMFLSDNPPEFDVIISFSSLEHSGLGRYTIMVLNRFVFKSSALHEIVSDMATI